MKKNTPKQVVRHPKRFNFASLIPFLVAFLFLTCTSVPVPFKLLAIFLVLLGFPDTWKNAGNWLGLALASTIYQCVVGVIYVAWFQKGDYIEACYPPLREFVIGLILLLAFKNATYKQITFFVLAWAVIQMAALLCELKGISWSDKFPFLFNSSYVSTSVIRLHGFTAESGVLGGLAGLFLLLLLIGLNIQPANRRTRVFGKVELLMSIIILLGILSLTLTKSGLFVLAASMPFYFWYAVAHKKYTVLVSSAVFLVIGIIGASYFITTNANARIYVETEIDNFSELMEGGNTASFKESGLASRVDGYELTFLGLLDYPFGLGYEGLSEFIAAHLNEIDQSLEMERNSSVSSNGSKGFLTNSLEVGGIPGGIFMVWLIFISTKPFEVNLRAGMRGMRWAVIAGLVALGLSVELLPVFGICAVVYCYGRALQREYL